MSDYDLDDAEGWGQRDRGFAEGWDEFKGQMVAWLREKAGPGPSRSLQRTWYWELADLLETGEVP